MAHKLNKRYNLIRFWVAIYYIREGHKFNKLNKNDVKSLSEKITFFKNSMTTDLFTLNKIIININIK